MRTSTLALLLVLGSVVCRAEVADYAVEVNSPRDSATFAVIEKKLTVKIKSAMGIGRMEIGLKTQDGKWPEAVVLSIQTKDGKPLRELEGFTLSGAKIRIQGSRRTSGKMDCHDVDANDPKAPKKNLRKVNVTVEKTHKALTVTIPGKVLQGERKVTIQWIDYYR